MLDQLLDLVKNNAQDLVVNNSEVPNEHNDAVIGEATNAIHDQLSQAVSQGNLQDVMGLFGNSQNLTSNPLVAGIIGQLTSSLGSKFGVNAASAQNIAGSLIPQVLSKFTQKTNDPNDSSFNINDVMGHLSGGKTSGVDFGNVVSQLQSGQGVDFGGLAGKLLGGNTGGLGDMLGGFLGK